MRPTTQVFRPQPTHAAAREKIVTLMAGPINCKPKIMTPGTAKARPTTIPASTASRWVPLAIFTLAPAQTASSSPRVVLIG